MCVYNTALITAIAILYSSEKKRESYRAPNKDLTSQLSCSYTEDPPSASKVKGVPAYLRSKGCTRTAGRSHGCAWRKHCCMALTSVCSQSCFSTGGGGCLWVAGRRLANQRIDRTACNTELQPNCRSEGALCQHPAALRASGGSGKKALPRPPACSNSALSKCLEVPTPPGQ